MTYTITIAPTGAAGKVTATSSDGRPFTTTTPLLDGARYWQQLGAPSSASIVTIWSSGPDQWSLRSTIGHAARLTVEESDRGGARFRKWVAFRAGAITGELSS